MVGKTWQLMQAQPADGILHLVTTVADCVQKEAWLGYNDTLLPRRRQRPKISQSPKTAPPPGCHT